MGSYQNFMYENTLFLQPQPQFSLSYWSGFDPFFFLGDIGMDYVFGFISISLTHINEINGSQVIENDKRFNYNCNLLSGKQGCSPHNLR